MTFDATVADGVLAVRRPSTRWLSTGWAGGYERADAAYNVTVPEGWDRTDLDAYVAERRDSAGFESSGPSLLTGVEMRHARGARLGPVRAFATVGLSNPAALPVERGAKDGDRGGAATTGVDDERATDESLDGERRIGTVNLVVGTTRTLDDGALATLLGVVVEAKAATLVALSGFPGTTSDAAVVGSVPDGESETFAGSATAVGAAARACVRDAVRASFRSRYASRGVPRSVDDADHGVVTDQRADVFEP
ncbi:adenosylcobinamide amidohydrolase [Halomicrococcus gelatinilyticus]|uniref:adenosylcobinamide amidohydrolase n=1 Tax=Halomicrococcus gelatinilyticus TaxID=1702103 RepID=UPI002E0E4EC4